MRIFIFLTALLLTGVAYAGNIEYGYNANGDYVPTKINGKRVDYGYNANGDYVPTKVGNDRIDYGYNANGNYVPTNIGR